MSIARLYPVPANKSRPSGQWSPYDYDVRDGPVIGRIYKQAFSPSGTPWFWGLLMFPVMATDSGAAETRDAAMAALKTRWLVRRG